eukprot:6231147-Prymnesium_polylepis.1
MVQGPKEPPRVAYTDTSARWGAHRSHGCSSDGLRPRHAPQRAYRALMGHTHRLRPVRVRQGPQRAGWARRFGA